MKKLMVLFLLMVALSCGKEEVPVCWKCTSYSYWDSNSVVSVADYCNSTEAEIIAMEKKWRDIGIRYECVKR